MGRLAEKTGTGRLAANAGTGRLAEKAETAGHITRKNSKEARNQGVGVVLGVAG
jgi:hypothetical protein